MADVSRRCGCRDENGKQFTAGRPCPKLKDPRHGTWGYRVSAGTVADPQPGKPEHRKRRYLSGSGYERRKDAQEALERALRAYRGQGDQFFNQTTVADYMAAWLDRLERDGEHKPTTIYMYRTYTDAHIVPALGEKRLTALKRADVAHFIDTLRAKTVTGQDYRPRPLGAVTVRRVVACLSSALGDAMRRGLIESNPAVQHELPAAERPKVTVWERADAVRFLEEARTTRLGPLFEFAISTGLRRGEICGLRWADVDLAQGRLTVNVNLVEVNGRVTEGAPKTKAGARTVLLSQDVVDLLTLVRARTEMERAEWGDHYTDSGRVFVHEDGNQLRPGHPSKWMERAVKRLGLPPAHFHSLRHQYASIQIDMGTELTLLSKMMGHSNIAITSNTYSHLFEERERKQAAAVSAWLRPSPETV